MAYTVSTIVNTVMGNLRLAVLEVTPDAATGVVTVPGAIAVDALVGVSKISGASLTCMTVTQNLDASGAVANGVIGFSNVVASQKYRVSVLYH